MSEWLKEHAWKSTLPARADAHQILPTHSPINNFRNSDLLRHIPVTDALHQGFRGVCDTVLTQKPSELKRMRVRLHRYVFVAPFVSVLKSTPGVRWLRSSIAHRPAHFNSTMMACWSPVAKSSLWTRSPRLNRMSPAL